MPENKYLPTQTVYKCAMNPRQSDATKQAEMVFERVCELLNFLLNIFCIHQDMILSNY